MDWHKETSYHAETETLTLLVYSFESEGSTEWAWSVSRKNPESELAFGYDLGTPEAAMKSADAWLERWMIEVGE